MISSFRKVPIEWAFVALMFLLCLILTVLQYRWTGELSRAEATRLRSGLSERAQTLARAFDTELAESCNQLLPNRSDIDEQNREAVHLARWRDWKSSNPRPVFRRIAIAVPSREGIRLLKLDPVLEKFVSMECPTEWLSLRDNLARKRTGGSPPFVDRTGSLLEFPIFAGSRRSGAGESEWFILEIDLDFLRSTWLPELVNAHLNYGETPLYDVEVRIGGGSGQVLYSSRTGSPENSEPPTSIRFHHQGKLSDSFRGGLEPGPDRGPQGRGFRKGSESGLWTLEVRHRQGAVEAVVDSSRRRNLSVAGFVNLLIVASGIALVFSTRRSRQLAEAQMTFVATVSHELRTPLTVIRGAAHNLMRGIVREPSQVERYSRLIAQHSEQLSDMVEQVLALAGARKGRFSVLLKPVLIAEILRDAIAATAEDTRLAGCKVQCEIPPSLPAVRGDATALCRVFQNLITNAAKHGGMGGWIGVTASIVSRTGHSMVEIQVADRGPGIPANERDDIFEPFFRGAAAVEHQVRGSGLGLNLVKKIVEAHNGIISFHCETRSGTAFHVLLPLIANHPP